jgi:hypothetical protein
MKIPIPWLGRAKETISPFPSEKWLDFKHIFRISPINHICPMKFIPLPPPWSGSMVADDPLLFKKFQALLVFRLPSRIPLFEVTQTGIQK